MAVSVRQFKAEFPEFEDTANNVVQSRLDMATRQINSAVYGTKTNDAIKWRAARLLAKGPLGEQSRLKAKDRASVYDSEDEALMRQVAHGFRVI